MYTRSGQESIVYAKKMNWVAEPADDNEIQLDLDTPEQEEQYRQMLPHVEDVYDIEDIVETLSKSGNKHVRIYTAYPLSVEERIALQAILGSDPKKELCSLRRWLQDDPIPILLFEKETLMPIDTNIDHEDMREAGGAYRDEDYERWLDQMAEEWAIMDEIETAVRAEKEEVRLDADF